MAVGVMLAGCRSPQGERGEQYLLLAVGVMLAGSLSARRAWIEMRDVSLNYKEVTSLSARRAWIEIDIPPNLDADRARRSPQGERG